MLRETQRWCTVFNHLEKSGASFTTVKSLGKICFPRIRILERAFQNFDSRNTEMGKSAYNSKTLVFMCNWKWVYRKLISGLDGHGRGSKLELSKSKKPCASVEDVHCNGKKNNPCIFFTPLGVGPNFWKQISKPSFNGYIFHHKFDLSGMDSNFLNFISCSTVYFRAIKRK